MWTHLNGFRGGWTDVPAPWCGHPDVFLGRVTLHQTWLPHGVLDAHVQMLLVHPDRAAESACWLPREFWWREDVEALLQPKAGAGSTCGGAARSAEVS
jgi:hypothetical protein